MEAIKNVLLISTMNIYTVILSVACKICGVTID